VIVQTTNPRRLRCVPGGTRLRWIALAGLLGGCHQEPPPPLYTGVAPDETTEAAPDAAPSSAPVGRGLWFSEGPGLDAQLARERQDHETAIEKLDALLADPELGPEDRTAALVLRALEDLELEHYQTAADRLAQARSVAALAAIDVWLRATEAQARLDASQPDQALVLVREVQPTPALAERMLVIEADARLRTHDEAGARAAYARYLEQFPRGSQRHAVRLRLAELRIGAKEHAAAAELLEAVALDVPLSQHGTDALARLQALEQEGARKLEPKARHGFERRLALAQLRQRLDRRDYRRVVRDADGLLARKDLTASQRCEVHYLQASAVFKQRERSRSRDYYERAIKACKRAGATDEIVKSRYQSARARYAQGRPADAAREFERLAADHPEHSYADDALIKAGEAWEEAGQADKARKAYASALEPVVRGDMAHEATRRLLVQAFAEARYDDALALADSTLAGGVNDRRERARLHYFRGRALAELGRAEQAREAWLTAVAQMPLSYPSAQALSRLREVSPDALKEGLRALEREQAAKVSLELPSAPAVDRARVFARLGLGDEARDELDAADVDGWPAAALLSQAGLYDAVQRELANLGAGWRGAPPVGAQRQLWEIAHPTPFTEIIEPGEKEHGVPPLLTFAIMQTESRFNPGVTSWAGAKGLVQLMPGTAKTVADRAGISLAGDDVLFDPATNLGLGMRYLAQLTRRWGGGDAGPALAIPSYNAGPGSVDKWVGERGDWPLDLFIESIPYDETRRYTQNVLERWAVYRWMYGEGDERLIYLPPKLPKRAE
jgi:soluble lytic murein transglycosylase